ncbi:MAG: RidA family protein [Acidobacteriota bacterium]|jgi:2-iminobutanoate/2-iminopropanoate deaminase|nr:RidA family protein [Acidobacteriota bacterium]
MKKVIQTEKAPAAIGPYSQAIEAAGTLYISGQLPVDPETGKIVEGGIEAQTEMVLKNIGAILQSAGMGYENVVKSTVLLADIRDFTRMNEIYKTFYTDNPPARAAFQVAALPLGAMIEIETIAVRL